MDCKHERLRCTNNQFFCLACGMKIDKPPEPEKKPEKKPVKRPAKKAKAD